MQEQINLAQIASPCVFPNLQFLSASLHTYQQASDSNSDVYNVSMLLSFFLTLKD